MEVHPLLWLRIHKVDPEAARWLREEATEWFMNHYQHTQHEDLEGKLAWFKRRAEIDSLSSLFVWNDTPQGHNFWQSIDRCIIQEINQCNS
jgi:hypothetical protein